MAFSVPNTIEFRSEITSAEHEQNYQAIVNDLNSNVIRKDGSVQMTAELGLFADPTSALGAATKAYVDAAEVAGVAKPFFGTSLPAGHAFCVGQTIARSSAPRQAAAIAPAPGAPFWVDATNFRLPDMRDRVPAGAQGAWATTVNTLGGSKDAATISHSHTIPDHNHSGSTNSDGAHGHNQTGFDFGANRGYLFRGPGGGGWETLNGSGSITWSYTTPDVSSSGSSHTHGFTTGGANVGHITHTVGVSGTNANLMPFITCNWIMRLI